MAARAKKTASRKSAKTSLKKTTPKTTTMKSSVKSARSQPVQNADFEPTKDEMRVQKKNGKKTLTLLVAIAVLLGLLYYFKDVFVVATVNGRPISRIAVVRELEKQNGKTTVDNLVTKELILQEAAKKGVVVTQEDVDNELKKIEDDLSKQGQKLDDVLTMQGLTKADVEENLRVKLYIEKILADDVSVSDDDAKKYFDENKASFSKDAKFEDQKDQIKEQLKQQKLNEKFQTWISDLKANAKINYFKTY